MKQKRIGFEIAICVIFFLIILLSSLSDLSVLSVPSFLVDRVDNVEDLYFTLFSVQASVSTISIAIVSIITGVMDDTAYGVSVSKFITSIKPPIFKHIRLIIANLVIVALNYFCVSFALFNSSIALFVISILINIILVKNACMVFSGIEEIHNQIKEYVCENYDEQIIIKLTEETINAVESGNSLVIKNNYEAYKTILNEEIKKGDKNNPNIIKYVSETISDVFGAVVKNHDAKKINDCILFICNIYDIANNADGNPIYLDIWNMISDDYFSGINDLSFLQLRDDFAHLLLRVKLYENIKGLSSDQLKGINIKYYSAWVYSLILNNSFSGEERERLTESLYKSVYFLPVEVKDNNALLEFYITELCCLNRVAIEKGDYDTLSKCFYKYVQARENIVSDIAFIVTTIYLYYLSAREKMVEGKPFQLNASKIIADNKNVISDFLFEIDIFNIVKIYYKMIYSMMQSWEYMDCENAKYMVIDSVIEDFFVFSVLGKINFEDNIEDVITSIAPTGSFSIYSRYFYDDKSNYLKDIYIKYNELFDEKLDEPELDYRISVLKNKFDQIYKREKIIEATNNEITEAMLSDLRQRCLSTLNKVSQECLRDFKFDNTINNSSDGILQEKRVNIYSTIIPSFFREKEYKSFIEKSIHSKLIYIFVKYIEPVISVIKKEYKEKDKQKTIINKVKSLGITPNVYIGNIDRYWNEKDKFLLHNFVLDMEHISFPKCRNILVILDSRMISFEIHNITVEFTDLSDEDLDSCIKVGEDGGLWYNVTNNIYLPFEVDELKEYVHKSKRRLTIYADIKYKLPDKIAGAELYEIFES